MDSALLLKVFTGVAFLVLVAAYATTGNHQKLYPGFETIGFEKGAISFSEGKKKFVAHGKELLLAGLRKCNGSFQVISDSGPVIIVPGRYVNELKKSDKSLNFDALVERDFFPSVPGFEGPKESIKSRVIQDSVRIKLTQSLNLITKDLCEETESTMHDTFGESRDWNSCYFQRICPDMVARLSSRVFLGPVVAHDQEWLRVAVDYTISIMGASRALRLWPSILAPFIYRFIPACRALRAQGLAARRIIDGEIKRRRVKWEEDRKNGKPVTKTADSLGWMQELSHGKPFDLSGGQLSLTFAAIHTTSDLLTKVMYKLCEHPEYIQPLRDEMVSVLSKEGWKKTSLYQMKLLDSTLKETQRVEPPSFSKSLTNDRRESMIKRYTDHPPKTAVFTRAADEAVTLPDGKTIPKGGFFKLFMDSAMDPNVFPNPETFDPYRFLKLRERPGEENSWQFVTTSPESLAFGHGMHACPGRFFASNEVKIALCWLLLKYDWKLEDGVSRPQNMLIATENIADPMLQLMYKRRTEEVDLMGLLETA